MKRVAVKKMVKVYAKLNNEKGSLDIFTTKLGLAVVTVLIIVGLMVFGPKSFTEMFQWFTATMQSRFNF